MSAVNFNYLLNLVSGTDFISEFVGAEGTPDSVNPSVVDEEEGLPSPPLDDGVFFATQPTSMELSQVHIIFLICLKLLRKVIFFWL